MNAIQTVKVALYVRPMSPCAGMVPGPAGRDPHPAQPLAPHRRRPGHPLAGHRRRHRRINAAAVERTSRTRVPSSQPGANLLAQQQPGTHIEQP
jgi:hypothetical protein